MIRKHCVLRTARLQSATQEIAMAKSTAPAKAARSTTRKVAQVSHPLEGKRAPAFEMSDADGNKVTLKSLTARGNVVLYFYPKDMTPGCTTEACNFRDNLDEIKAADAQVVGVSADSAA